MRKEEGSITLEAAMVLPFFMLFIVFLATIIRISIADMALYQSVSETNEVIATHAYPADLATTAVEDILNDKLSGIHEDLDLNLAASLLTDSMEYLDINIDVNGYLQSISADLLEPVIQDKFADKVGGSFFDSSNLSIDQVTHPTSFTGDGAFIEIDASYKIDVAVPFVNKQIILKKTSYERLWAGS